jgi:hypothetical protein
MPKKAVALETQWHEKRAAGERLREPADGGKAEKG